MSSEQQLLKTKALAIYDLLLQKHGKLPLTPRREPMHELISTMLSHRTTQKNEDLAFHAMWDRYGSWEAIRDANFEELATTIEQAQFPGAKAANIQKALTLIVQQRGAPSIDFLADLPPQRGLEWLLSLPGVGTKTASLVLLFCFGKPVLPVDTHVHRVSQRTGLIGERDSAEAAHRLLLDLLPPDPYVLFNFHVSMLRHGQKICIWGNPRCHLCPLTELCNWYQTHRAVEQTA